MTRRIGSLAKNAVPSGRGLDRAGEAEIGQRRYEVGAKAAGAGQPVLLLSGKA